MERKLIVTSDGSYTFYLPAWDEHYHSKYGAFTESIHLFINHGFHSTRKNEINILEVGFGTGLNAFLTFIENQKNKKSVFYEALEKYPLKEADIQLLNYTDLVDKRFENIFIQMHKTTWEEKTEFSGNFTLLKKEINLLDYKPEKKFDIVYFDAFAPDLQPELWTDKVFSLLYNTMNTDGTLVTYSTKGSVRRNMMAAGFKVEKIPGPVGGKKENLRAFRRQ